MRTRPPSAACTDEATRNGLDCVIVVFLFRGEFQGPASIANARFIDDTLSLRQRVVNRNCLNKDWFQPFHRCVRSSRSNV